MKKKSKGKVAQKKASVKENVINRPTVVTIFGVIEIIFSILGLIGSVVGVLALFFLSGLQIFPEDLLVDLNVPMWYFVVSFFMAFVVIIIRLIAAINLLKLKLWAWKLLIGVAIFNVVWGILEFWLTKIFFAMQIPI